MSTLARSACHEQPTATMDWRVAEEEATGTERTYLSALSIRLVVASRIAASGAITPGTPSPSSSTET